MIASQQLRGALTALGSDHRFVGVRPADSVEPEGPAVLIGDISGADRTVNSLMMALDTATQYWPQCDRWELVAGEECLQQQAADWPPRMFRIRSPQLLVQFNSASENDQKPDNWITP